jgi:hypothetical protein
MMIYLIVSLGALLPSALAVLWLMWRSSSLPGARKVRRTLYPRSSSNFGGYRR